MTFGGNWRDRYERRIGVLDGVVVIWAVVGAHLTRFGVDGESMITGSFAVPYILLTLTLPCIWWLMIGAWGSREPRILGSGPEEYKRVFASSLWLFGALAIISYAFQIDLARGYVGIAFPTGVAGLIAGRWILRQHLNLDRVNGDSTSRLLLVGAPGAISHLVEALRRHPQAGYFPVATYVPGIEDTSAVQLLSELPVLGTEASVAGIMGAVRTSRADSVAISGGVQLNPIVMRHLGWELAACNIGLIVAPTLTDIAGPRIHTQPVAGLPLIHVTTPKLEGGKRLAKRLFDIAAASLLLTVFSPLMLVIFFSIKTDSAGPALFKQERVGIQGSLFTMYKFRSMGLDAEQRLADLQSRSEGNGVLFKLKVDPRVTRVGGFLRKFSLDELPQLLNVFTGAMSLVGPRPPLAAEVDAYEEHVRRRLLVKPGLTGLWQVSGRSNLSWQDSVRLDLYYVENWSMMGDFVILLKTARAVLMRDGAY